MQRSLIEDRWRKGRNRYGGRTRGYQNGELLAWLEDVKRLCKPEDVHMCDGSAEEYEQMCDSLVKHGTFTRLNENLRPNCFLARSHPSDVARVEDRTYICTHEQIEAGPTNNWADSAEMKVKMTDMFDGCMAGRTMYVIPFSMGPVGSPFSKIGIEVTDSAYVVANMMIMTRVGTEVLEALGTDGEFIPCLHSVGAPLAPGPGRRPWPCERDPGQQVHRALPRRALHLVVRLGLRRQRPAGQEVPGAAHRLGRGPQRGLAGRAHADPWSDLARGQEALHRGRLPQRVRQDQPGHDAAHPSRAGRCTCVGDDIAWMRIGDDGRLYAMNPETGFFGVAPGTSYQSNPNAMEAFTKNSIFTNAALTDDGDIWWEDMGVPAPAHLIDWEGNDWTPDSGTQGRSSQLALHRSGRAVPGDRPRLGEPGRRAHLGHSCSAAGVPAPCPLVNEAFDWEHGVFMGSAAGSETTAANLSKTGVLRHDPFAMLPFCGYNMGDYFAHWLSMAERTDASKLPKVFFVNWFRKGEDGHWLWPGYGENSRVLKWIFERVEGSGKAVETPIGNLPAPGCARPLGPGRAGRRPRGAADRRRRGLEDRSGRHGRVLRELRRPSAAPRCAQQLAALQDRLRRR